jgi:hypothetical protein
VSSKYVEEAISADGDTSQFELRFQNAEKLSATNARLQEAFPSDQGNNQLLVDPLSSALTPMFVEVLPAHADLFTQASNAHS